MKIFTPKQIKEIDAYTIEHEPIASIDLMERAATSCANWIEENVDKSKELKIIAGPGNNGGDGIAIARILADRGFEKISLYLVKISEQLSPDAQTNLQRLEEQGKAQINTIADLPDLPDFKKEDVLIDAIFGSGLTRKVSGIAASVIQKINKSGGKIISIDIPSGLFGEDNTGNDVNNIVKATYTLSFQFPKLAFFFQDNYLFVGKWIILPIGLHQEFINDKATPYHFLTSEFIGSKLIQRDKFSHKGIFGSSLFIGGSHGKMGAAVIASRACLRAGAGLLTVHVPKCGYEIMQISVPEAMVTVDSSKKYFTSIPDISKYSSLGIGPGIGTKSDTREAFRTLLESTDKPIVIDADGLNILAKEKQLLKNIPPESILTPHPKEFERVAGKYGKSYDRLQKQREFSMTNSVYVVLKGAHTTITCPDGTVYFNTTGNPGMATAGSGDVLTGIILGLLSQEYSPRDAALIGVYLHGLAGDIAAHQNSQEAIIASDIINSIGAAYINVKEGK